MAKQASHIKLTGSMGNVTYYQDPVTGEYLAREKSGPSREQVLNSDKFARTRENASEFGRTAQAGMLVRHSLCRLIKTFQLADNPLSGRLNAMMKNVIKSDPVGVRGMRMVSMGQVDMLEDFEFRKEKKFSSVFAAGPVSMIDTETGRMKLSIKPFDPRERMDAPVSATHFKIILNGSAIHFEQGHFDWGYQESEYISLEEALAAPICLDHAQEARPGNHLLLSMGVVFYAQGEDGRFEQVEGGVMKILQVAVAEAAFQEVVPEVQVKEEHAGATAPQMAAGRRKRRRVLSVKASNEGDVGEVSGGDRRHEQDYMQVTVVDSEDVGRGFVSNGQDESKSMTLEEYNRELEEADEEIEAGDFVTHEEVMKRYFD